MVTIPDVEVIREKLAAFAAPVELPEAAGTECTCGVLGSECGFCEATRLVWQERYSVLMKDAIGDLRYLVALVDCFLTQAEKDAMERAAESKIVVPNRFPVSVPRHVYADMPRDVQG